MILDHYFLNLNSKNPENLIIINIINNLNNLIPGSDNKKGLAYCLAVGFCLVFTRSEFHEIDVDDNEIGINRYDAIQELVKLLRNFILKLNSLGKDLLYKNEDDRNNFKILIGILLHILINCDLIKKKKQKNFKFYKELDILKNDTPKKINKNTYKTEIYVTLICNKNLTIGFGNLKLLLTPSNLIKLGGKYYLTGGHYSNYEPLIHKNKLGRETPQINNLEFIKSRCQMKLYFRWDFFEFIKKLTCNYYHIDENITYNEICSLLNFKKKKIGKRTIQREFNKIFSIAYFFKISQIKNFLLNGVYFYYYFDFRGRLYANSPISYTNNIFFRQVYSYGIYSIGELNNFRKNFDMKDLEYVNYILINTNIQQNYSAINYFDVVDLYYIEIIFFEIGKLFKHFLIKNLNGKISKFDFIKWGVEYYNKASSAINNEKLETQIDYGSLIYVLEELNKKIYLKKPIFKDATASGPQICALLLGVKDHEIYDGNNLTTKNIGFDTYWYIINKFLDIETMPLDIKEKYFTRSTLKKIIMTYNYNATYLKCWDYFREDANLPGNSKENLNIEIEIYFKKFYNFLKTIFNSNEYYNHPALTITTYFKNFFDKNQQLFFKTDDDFLIYLKYYILEQENRNDRSIQGDTQTRETIVGKKLTDRVDERKTFRAVQANFIHIIDGYIIRKISLILNKPVITIHDCVGIDILTIKEFENAAIQTMNHLYALNILKLNMNPIIIKSNMIFL